MAINTTRTQKTMIRRDCFQFLKKIGSYFANGELVKEDIPKENA